MAKRTILLTTLFAGAILTGRAESAGLDASGFSPGLGARGLMTVERSTIARGVALGSSLYMSYADSPLVVRDQSLILERIISNQTQAHFVGTVSFARRIEFGVGLPTVLSQSGDRGLVQSLRSSGIGDLRLALKGALLDDRHRLFDRIGFALALSSALPTGSIDAFSSADTLVLQPEAIFDFDFSSVDAALNLGYRYRKNPIDLGDLNVANEWIYRFGLGIDLFRSPVSLISELFGRTAVKNPFGSQFQSPAEWLSGLRYHHVDGFIATVAGGTAVSRGYSAPEWRLVAQLGFSPPSREPPQPPPMVVAEPPPPPPEPVPVIVDTRPKKVIRLERQLTKIGEKIFFEFNKARLLSKSFEPLDRVANILTKYPKIRVRVEGHTDDRGGQVYNLRLSLRRSHSVRQYLIASGIDESRLISKGYGKSTVVSKTENPNCVEELSDACRDYRRRVQFKILDYDLETFGDDVGVR